MVDLILSFVIATRDDGLSLLCRGVLACEKAEAVQLFLLEGLDTHMAFLVRSHSSILEQRRDRQGCMLDLFGNVVHLILETVDQAPLRYHTHRGGRDSIYFLLSIETVRQGGCECSRLCRRLQIMSDLIW
jgi:hypothetical protein